MKNVLNGCSMTDSTGHAIADSTHMKIMPTNRKELQQ